MKDNYIKDPRDAAVVLIQIVFVTCAECNGGWFYRDIFASVPFPMMQSYKII